jgi:hypothetical protein
MSKGVMPADKSQSNATQTSSRDDSVESQFESLANMSPFERMRAGILKSMGLSEQDLQQMSPQQRQAVEDCIQKAIEQQLKQKAGQTGQVVDVSA